MIAASKKPTPQQKARAHDEVQEIIDKYNPGTPNTNPRSG